MKNKIKCPKLSKKLMAIANLVEGCAIADVGCDHGYLSIYLAVKGDFKIYACDVKEKPLKKAKNNAKIYGVYENICFILSDGLLKVPKDVDCVIIAGIGGKLIMRIILEQSWVKNENIKFIIQPQSFLYYVRKNLYLNGFKIEKEVTVLEKNKGYDIFVVRYVGVVKKLSFKETILGKLDVYGDGHDFEFLKLDYIKNKNILRNLKRANVLDEKKIKIYEDICSLQNFFEL